MKKSPSKRTNGGKQGEERVILPAPGVDEVVGSPDALERARAAAFALPEERVLPYDVDASLAYHNAVKGRDAVLKARAAVEATGFNADWELIRSIGELGLALVHAHALVDGDGRTRGTLRALVTSAAPVRRKLLTAAVALAAQGLLPSDTVRSIKKGRGSRDLGADLLALTTLFRSHAAAIAGQHPVSAAQLQEAAELGTRITENSRGPRVKRERGRVGDARSAAELRDRVYTLLVHGHQHLAQTGGALWGLDVVKRIPSLRSGVRKKKAESPPVE